jgi:hypothetical protein
MALKKQLSKQEFDALREDLKSEYVPTANGYRLDLSDDSDSLALKNAKDRESQLRHEAEERLLAAQTELEKLTAESGARGKQDLETMRKAWEKQAADKEKAAQVKIDKLAAFAQNSLIDNVANRLASELFTPNSAKLLTPHVRARLGADLESETFSTKVLDKNGKASILTTEDLKKEFLADKEFSAFLLGSKASGSAVSSLQAKTVGTGGESVSFSKLSFEDKVQYLRSTSDLQTK